MASYLRFTPHTLEEALVRPRLTVLVALGTLACGGGPGPGKPVPQSPQETLAQFMSAVKANDLLRMGTLWGSDRGPAADWMKGNELKERLTVIQKYLAHAGHRVVEAALERAVEIRYAVTHVMDAWPALREELRHRAGRVARLEELDVDVAQRQADDGRAVGALGMPGLEPEHVAIEREGGVDGRNSNA